MRGSVVNTLIYGGFTFIIHAVWVTEILGWLSPFIVLRAPAVSPCRHTVLCPPQIITMLRKAGEVSTGFIRGICLAFRRCCVTLIFVR